MIFVFFNFVLGLFLEDNKDIYKVMKFVYNKIKD